MPPLSQQTFREVVDLLSPLLRTEEERRVALIFALGIGHPLLAQIDYAGSAYEFTISLISRLVDYGELEPGQTALWAVLDSISDRVGVEYQERIRALEPSINGTGNGTVPHVSTSSNRYQERTRDIDKEDFRDNEIINIFISHKNAKLENEILEDLNTYMKDEIERAGGNLFYDRLMDWGTSWDKVIRQQLERADIALLFISQGFLNSQYIRQFEIPSFLQRRANEGLFILPLIIEECTWRRHDWIHEILVLPDQLRDLRTAKAYRREDRTDELYFQITESLIAFIEQIRAHRS